MFVQILQAVFPSRWQCNNNNNNLGEMQKVVCAAERKWCNFGLKLGVKISVSV